MKKTETLLNKKTDLKTAKKTAKELYNQCGTIRRILIASINTAKENSKWNLLLLIPHSLKKKYI